MKKIIFFLILIIQSTIIFSQGFSVESLGLKMPVFNNCTETKNQYNSSTCWSFSSNSFLESELIKNGKGYFDLSEMYVARYSYYRKIKTYLNNKGKNFFTPGGQFHDVAWVMKHYGMEPESAYSGKNRNEMYHDHAELDTAIKHYVDDLLNSGVTVLHNTHMHYLDSVFDYYLGVVPQNFNYNKKNYTPQTFLKDAMGINLDDYIEVTSYSNHPFYTKYVLEDKYNWTGDLYYNVPIKDFSAITDNALKTGYTISWDGDAEETTFEYEKGLAYLPFTGNDFQIERQRTVEDSSTQITHMMHIVGSIKDNKAQKWYCVKNSWGDYSNQLGGFLFMSDAYFKIKTGAIIVNKKAIPTAILKKMKL